MLILSALLLLPLLFFLGVWQLDRAEEKAQLMERWSSTEYQSQLPLRGGLDEHSLVPVVIAGRFDTQRYLLLDNRTREGHAGYEVLTMFDSNGQLVLVNLGWIKATHDRSVLPEVLIPDQLLTIKGAVRLMRPSFVLSDVQERDNWPRVMQSLNYSKLQTLFGQRLEPFEFKLHESVVAELDHQWAVSEFKPERHIGYAVQWFSMALVLILLLLWGWRVVNREVRYE